MNEYLCSVVWHLQARVARQRDVVFQNAFERPTTRPHMVPFPKTKQKQSELSILDCILIAAFERALLENLYEANDEIPLCYEQ